MNFKVVRMKIKNENEGINIMETKNGDRKTDIKFNRQ